MVRIGVIRTFHNKATHMVKKCTELFSVFAFILLRVIPLLNLNEYCGLSKDYSSALVHNCYVCPQSLVLIGCLILYLLF